MPLPPTRLGPGPISCNRVIVVTLEKNTLFYSCYMARCQSHGTSDSEVGARLRQSFLNPLFVPFASSFHPPPPGHLSHLGS